MGARHMAPRASRSHFTIDVSFCSQTDHRSTPLNFFSAC